MGRPLPKNTIPSYVLYNGLMMAKCFGRKSSSVTIMNM